MSKDKIIIDEEKAELSIAYAKWHGEQGARDKARANDELAIAEAGEQALPPKMSLHREAVAKSKTGDHAAKRNLKNRKHAAKMLTRIGHLLDSAVNADKNSIVEEFGYEKFTGKERTEQLLNNAIGEIVRTSGDEGRKKNIDGLKKARRKFAQEEANAQDAEVRADVSTWGDEAEEFVSVDEKETVETFEAALKKYQDEEDEKWNKWAEDQISMTSCKETEKTK